MNLLRNDYFFYLFHKYLVVKKKKNRRKYTFTDYIIINLNIVTSILLFFSFFTFYY